MPLFLSLRPAHRSRHLPPQSHSLLRPSRSTANTLDAKSLANTPRNRREDSIDGNNIQSALGRRSQRRSSKSRGLQLMSSATEATQPKYRATSGATAQVSISYLSEHCLYAPFDIPTSLTRFPWCPLSRPPKVRRHSSMLHYIRLTVVQHFRRNKSVSHSRPY